MTKKASKKTTKKVEKKPSLFDAVKAKMKKNKPKSMSNKSDSLIPWKIPFKHKALQKATGGLLGGKIMMIEGFSQTGKCLAEGTLISTPTGPVAIEKLSKGDLVIGYNNQGELEATEVMALIDNGIQEVHQLRNKHRFLAESTLDHKWATHIKTGCGSTYEACHTLKEIAGSTSNYRNKVLTRYFDYDFKGEVEPHAYAIGAFLGDGCSRQGVSGLHISSRDEKIPEKVASILGAKHCYKQNEDNHTYILAQGRGRGYNHDKLECNYFDEFLKGKYAHEKDFPIDLVKSWDKESILNFIAGLVDTDGHVTFTDSSFLTLGFSSTSKELATLFQDLIYYVFQIKPRILEDNRDDRRLCYDVRVSDNFNSNRIIKKLSPYLVCEWKKHLDVYETLEKHINPDYMGVKLGESRKCQTYDISIDNGTHLFMLHDYGLITHNSFLGYELISGAVSAGGTGYLQDREQAYEPDYGAKAGMDDDDMFFYDDSVLIEPTFDTWVEWMKATREVVKDKSIPLVIMDDSFAVSRCLEQGESDEKGKALGYGSMKKNNAYYDRLAMLQPLLQEYSCSLVIINQLTKDHAAGMFADPTKRKGPQLEYFCSQILRGKAGQKITVKRKLNSTERKVQVGMTSNWETAKNRFVEPMKKFGVKIYFRRGLAPWSGLGDFLVLEDEVKQKSMKDPEDGRKTIKGYTYEGPDGEEFFPEDQIKDMCKKYPNILEPRYTSKLSDDFDDEEVELEDYESEKVKIND